MRCSLSNCNAAPSHLLSQVPHLTFALIRSPPWVSISDLLGIWLAFHFRAPLGPWRAFTLIKDPRYSAVVWRHRVSYNGNAPSRPDELPKETWVSFLLCQIQSCLGLASNHRFCPERVLASSPCAVSDPSQC